MATASFGNFGLSKYDTILSAATGFEGYGIFADDASKTKVKCDDILSQGSELTDSMKWNFVPSANVAEVAGDLVMGDGIYNLKNSWYSLYLIDDNGKAVYGNAKPSDKNAQWQFSYDQQTKKTALKNVGSGQYLYANAGTGIFHYRDFLLESEAPHELGLSECSCFPGFCHSDQLSAYGKLKRLCGGLECGTAYLGNTALGTD